MDNQELLSDEPDDTSSGGLLRWLVVIVVMALILGLGYWYYMRFISAPAVASTPSPEVSVAEWKVKSEKTVDNFLTYLKNSQTQGDDQLLKARDLLTSTAQAKLETTKSQSGNMPGNLSDKLKIFIDIQNLPQNYQILSSRRNEDGSVDVSVQLSYNQEQAQRAFRCLKDNNVWLIDQVINPNVPSPTPTPTLTLSPTPVFSPIMSPSPVRS